MVWSFRVRRTEARPVRGSGLLSVARFVPWSAFTKPVPAGASNTTVYSPGGEVRERVVAAGVRRGRAEHVVVRVEKGDLHARNARLALILHVVAASVLPDPVAEAQGAVDARVDVQVVLGEGDHVGQAAAVHVAVHGLVRADVAAREGVARGLVELDPVLARLECSVEQVAAPSSRSRR